MLYAETQDRGVRWAAVRAIGEIGPKAKAAVPTLIEILRRDSIDRAMEYSAVWALGEIGPEAAPAVPALIEYLPRGGTIGATETARSFGKIGPDAKSAIPALYRLRRETRDKNLGKAINEAIWRIREQASPVLPDIEKSSAHPLQLVQVFSPTQILNYMGLPARATKQWKAGDLVRIEKQVFTVQSIRPAFTDAYPRRASFDIVVLDVPPVRTYGKGTPVIYLGARRSMQSDAGHRK
jgi:hypothetical protein